MKRQVIKIDRDKCDGCGICVTACHEGAIGLADGKAELLRDDYCDGLGDCLPACPAGAITFEEREAVAYNKNAQPDNREKQAYAEPPERSVASELRQWPIQIKLAPINAPFFQNASLLVSADCAAYAYGNFHNDYMRGKVTLIGCPKLDQIDYSEKLTDIIKSNNIKSVTVIRMEVPCCGGIEYAVKTALKNSGKIIPWQVVTISTDGQVLDDM